MKKALSFLLAVVMTAATVAAVLPASAASGFLDVEDGRWSAASIGYAVDNGYMNGVGEDRFDPEGSLTRAMVATVLWRREGSPAPTAQSGFEDVPAQEWYTDAVAWARSAGVVKGLTMTTFGPDEFITREQLATMLFRFSSAAPASVPERADLSAFADNEKVSDWADEPLEWAVQADLIKGTDGNRLAPDGYATREQFAAIIERYDGAFRLKYNTPVIRSHYTEKEYPLVTDADIYVSSDGDDSNPGTFDAPLASFAGAAAKVREIKAAGTGGDIVVAFRAGDYGPPDAYLSPEDGGSPDQRIIYCAYGDGAVKFTGGPRVTLDEFVPLEEEDMYLFKEKSAGKIMKADLSGKNAADGVTRDSETFAYGYGRLDAARYPNKPAESFDDIYLEGVAEGIAKGQTRIAPLTNRFKSYHTVEGAKMIGCIGNEYWKNVFPLTGFDPETGIIHYEPLRSEGLSPYAIGVFFINVSEELDTNNESYVDPETKTLYVYNPQEEEYIVSASEHFAVLDGAGYLTFRGIDFEGCLGDGFLINADGVEFDRCKIFGISGESGIRVTGVDFRMQDCEFSYTAGRGMWFDSGRSVDDLVPTGPYVDNCFIHHTGQLWRNLEHPGIRIKRAVGAKVTHCEISESPCAALTYGYCAEEGPAAERAIDCLFEYNVIRDAAYDLSDVGAIYTGRSFVNRDNTFRYNLILQENHHSGCFAMYMDDGVAAQNIYGNVFYNFMTLMHSGGQYMNIHDNVFISTGSGSDHESFRAWDKYYNFRYDENAENPTAWNSGNFRILYGTLALRPGPESEYYELWRSRWPELYEIIDDYDDVENPNCPATPCFCSIYNNYSIGCTGTINPAVMKFAVRCENNPNLAPDGNPCFVNPTRGDYRIRDGADCPDIRFEEIGRY